MDDTETLDLMKRELAQNTKKWRRICKVKQKHQKRRANKMRMAE